jgi:hypothetical protein
MKVEDLKAGIVSPQARWEGKAKGCTAARTVDLYLEELQEEGKVEINKGRVRLRKSSS